LGRPLHQDQKKTKEQKNKKTKNKKNGSDASVKWNFNQIVECVWPGIYTKGFIKTTKSLERPIYGLNRVRRWFFVVLQTWAIFGSCGV
jgi:hypothetical protein